MESTRSRLIPFVHSGCLPLHLLRFDRRLTHPPRITIRCTPSAMLDFTGCQSSSPATPSYSSLFSPISPSSASCFGSRILVRLSPMLLPLLLSLITIFSLVCSDIERVYGEKKPLAARIYTQDFPSSSSTSEATDLSALDTGLPETPGATEGEFWPPHAWSLLVQRLTFFLPLSKSRRDCDGHRARGRRRRVLSCLHASKPTHVDRSVQQLHERRLYQQATADATSDQIEHDARPSQPVLPKRPRHFLEL
jgi:hypothetical protein